MPLYVLGAAVAVGTHLDGALSVLDQAQVELARAAGGADEDELLLLSRAANLLGRLQDQLHEMRDDPDYAAGVERMTAVLKRAATDAE